MPHLNDTRANLIPKSKCGPLNNHIDDSIDHRKQSFVVGVLADLSGKSCDPLPKLRDRRFITIDRENFDRVMYGIRPRLAIRIDNTLQYDGSKLCVELRFTGMDDFKPDAVARQVEPLRLMLSTRDQLSFLLAKLDGNEPLRTLLQNAINDTKVLGELASEIETDEGCGSAPSTGGHLDRIITEGRMVHDVEQRWVAKVMIAEFVAQLMSGQMTDWADTQAMIHRRIAEIDSLLSQQLKLIIHHPEFQKLEASWRGLNDFVGKIDTGPHLKIKVLNVSKKDLLHDQMASEFDQNVLFKKVYEEELGTFGGEPFSILIGDYEFGRFPQDVALLEEDLKYCCGGQRSVHRGGQPSTTQHGQSHRTREPPRS